MFPGRSCQGTHRNFSCESAVRTLIFYSHVVIKTHNVTITSPIADFAVSLGSDGRLLSQGTISTVLKVDQFLSAEIELEKKEAEKAEEIVDEVALDVPVKQGAGKLILAEEISEGRVTWTACE